MAKERRAAEAALAFRAMSPDWYPTEKNKNALFVGAMARPGEITVENLSIVWHEMKARGVADTLEDEEGEHNGSSLAQ